MYYCKGQNRPILTLQERAMTCLSCKVSRHIDGCLMDNCDINVVSLQYVDDVVIGAPYAITEDLLDHFQVQ